MEYIDIYDRFGRKTGKTAPRYAPRGPEEFFRSVLVGIFTPDGRMLIQQRTDNKAHWPGLWDLSCCGALSAGENSRQAGEREVFEELGLKIDLSLARPAFVNAFTGGFNDAFLLTMDIDPADLRLQAEEVQRVRLADEQEILSLIDSGRFIPYKKAWVSLLFDCRTRPGTINV